MSKKRTSTPVDLKNITVTDPFWEEKMRLVRKVVIPYQWELLNDRVPDAEPSYCMHNFKAAAKINARVRKEGAAFAPSYTFRGFQTLPEDPKHPEEDRFYGFVFQDTDFSKWIEAVGYSLSRYPDAELEKIADGAIDIVCDAQAENGYLDTYYIVNGMDAVFSNLRDNHELYCLGHLVEGAVSYYKATGKDKLLRAACRFADYVGSCFGPEEGKLHGYPGHEIAEMALFRLYEVTKDEKYRDLAAYFVNERGSKPYYFEKEHPEDKSFKGDEDFYHQAHLPVREQTEAVGHAVRAVYLYSGMADMARITGDETLKKACERLFNSIARNKLYITGGIGGTHMGEAFSYPYDLPNDTAYSETCAAIGLVFFARRMLQMDPDSRYSDVMEQALYNTVLSGMALDGKSFFYVNPLEADPVASKRDKRKAHVETRRQKWYGCACCPPNISRLISSLGNYAYTENEDTLFVHLYMSGKVEVGGNAEVCIDSDLLKTGKVSFRVNNPENRSFTLALRIPGWCRNQYEISGGLSNKGFVEKGYLYLDISGKETVFSLHFDLKARYMEASPKVKEDVGQLAVMRGPVVYCVEEADNGKGLHLLRFVPENPIEEDDRKDLPWDAGYEKKTEEGPQDPENMIFLKTRGKRLIASSDSEGENEETDDSPGLYRVYEPGNASDLEEDVEIRLIPYYLWANRDEGEMRVFLRR